MLNTPVFHASPSAPADERPPRRAVPRIRPLLAGILLACACWPAQAAPYRVELDAPAPLKGLLSDYLDLFRYRDRDNIDAEQLDFMIATAPEQVERLASTEGYFSPQTRVEVRRDNGTTVVRLSVAPGERTTVAKADIGVSGEAAAQSTRQVERLRRNWALKPGAPFRQEEWDNAKEAGLQVLQRRRYPAARIASSQARVDADRHAAELTVDYDSGPLFTLGEVSVTGARRYPEQIIRNVNPLKSGEEYSAERLLEFQRQIMRTPYYSNVVIHVDPDPARAKGAPVEVQVTEFPKQRIRGGAGYTTDTGAQVNGRYSHNDVFRRAWVLDTQLRLEQERQFGSIDLAMPPDEHAFVNSGRFSLERTTLENLDLRSRRIGVRRARETDRRDIAYTLEHFSDRLERESGTIAPRSTVVEEGTHQALVLGVEQTRRQVDNLVFPRDGRIVMVQLGAALKGVLTDQSFFRLYARGREYLPIGRRDLVIVRGELGYILTKGGNASIPASLLFRAGGTESVRGYAFQSIGNVRDGTVYPTRFMLTGGVEYQHWLERRIYDQRLGAAVFYDAGTATDRWSDRKLYHAVGVGVRWRSPVGRVNVDLAYGIQEKNIRPHISLGVAF